MTYLDLITDQKDSTAARCVRSVLSIVQGDSGTTRIALTIDQDTDAVAIAHVLFDLGFAVTWLSPTLEVLWGTEGDLLRARLAVYARDAGLGFCLDVGDKIVGVGDGKNVFLSRSQYLGLSVAT